MLRRLVPLVLVVLVVGAVALVVTSRPELDDAEAEVQQQWDAIDDSLNDRYQRLAALTTAIGDSGTTGALVRETGDALGAWQAVRDGNASVSTAVATANDVEALTRRLDATVRASAQLTARPEVAAALNAVATAEPPAGLEAFNEAVRAYADERTGPVRSLLADLLGYDPLPTLDIQVPP